jgi:hypothetical protein
LLWCEAGAGWYWQGCPMTGKRLVDLTFLIGDQKIQIAIPIQVNWSRPGLIAHINSRHTRVGQGRRVVQGRPDVIQRTAIVQQTAIGSASTIQPPIPSTSTGARPIATTWVFDGVL